MTKTEKIKPSGKWKPDDIYLYLLMRDDLPSLNPGKAVAHGAHAAQQSVYEMNQRYAINSERMDMLRTWESSTALGFGTTIALSVNQYELASAVRVAQALGLDAGITVDPTYPYIVDREMKNLIDHAYPPKNLGGGRYLCLREETTAGYVFGLKEEISPVLGNFPLMA